MHINDGFIETIVAYCHLDTPETKLKKIQILVWAMEQFINEGYHASTIEKIGKKASCSKQKVFYYFATKEDLALKILKVMQLYYRKKIFIFTVNETNPAQGIRHFIEFIAAEITGYRDCLSLLEILDRELASSRVIVEEIKAEWIKFLSKILQPLHGSTSEYVAKIGFIFIMKYAFSGSDLKHDNAKLSSYLKRGLRLIWVGHIFS